MRHACRRRRRRDTASVAPRGSNGAVRITRPRHDMPDLDVDIDPDTLKPGTRLGEFEIERVLGIGGFGIVYLAFDHALERRVALKEYMPLTLAARRNGSRIVARTKEHAKTFGIGLNSFVNEARLLARFDQPALVKVYRFWEDNGTAYMVMPFYEGMTLGHTRAAMPAPPAEAWLLEMADAMLGALESLHRERVYHRDVAPDNILVQTNGAPVLLDFGAARHVIGDRTQSLTAILKPNFAPIEQYADAGPLRQGPWSDIYSLGAVLHFCLIGRAPVPATQRVLRDELPSLRALRAELIAADGTRYSERFLQAIDAALNVLPENRPQDATDLRARLLGDDASVVYAAAASSMQPQAAHQAGRTSFASTVALSRTAEAAPGAEAASAPPGIDRDHRQKNHEGAPLPGDATSLPWPPWISSTPRRAAALSLALTLIIVAVLTSSGAIKPPSKQKDLVAELAPVAVARQVSNTATVSEQVKPAPKANASDDQGKKTSSPSRPSNTSRPVVTARSSCGDRNFFSMQWCLIRQCTKPQFARDPECIERSQPQSNQSDPRLGSRSPGR